MIVVYYRRTVLSKQLLRKRMERKCKVVEEGSLESGEGRLLQHHGLESPVAPG